MEGLGNRGSSLSRQVFLEDEYFLVIQTKPDVDAAAFIRDAQKRNRIFDVNFQDPRSLSRNPMLHQAAARGKALTCKALLENRDIWFHQGNAFNETALDLAIRRQDYNCCMALLNFLFGQKEERRAGRQNQYRPLQKLRDESENEYGYRIARLLKAIHIDASWDGNELVFEIDPREMNTDYDDEDPEEIAKEVRGTIDEQLLGEYLKRLYDEEHKDEFDSDSEGE